MAACPRARTDLPMARTLPSLRGWLILSLVVASSMLTAACGSSGETVVVTQRPQRGYPVPSDSVTSAPPPVAVAGLDTVNVGEFPGGRLWLFDDPPLEYLRDRYGVEADTSWLNHIRLATIRLPNCTASFVSPRGLVITNYHCVRDQIDDLEEKVDSIRLNGFAADSLGAELPIDELYADQLIGITDVTRRVRARVDHLSDDDRREEVLRATVESLKEQLTASAKQRDTTFHVEVVELYSGLQYAAYEFRRIHDLRMVLVPDRFAGRFGGDTQNFSYPRFTLDFALLRAYDDQGEPLESPYHFTWSESGVSEGDVVFTAGNPGTTNRLLTVSQLEYERDVELPNQLAVLGTRAAAINQFMSQHPALADSFDVESMLMSIRNVQKDTRGRLDALRDPAFMRRVQALAARTEAALADRDSLRRSYQDATRALAAVQRTKRASANQVNPFAMFGSTLIDSHVLIRSIYAYLFDFTRQRGVPESFLDTYRSSGRKIEPLPAQLEAALLAARLREFEHHLGEGDPSVRGFLRGRTPEQAAADIISATALVDSTGFDSLLAAGYLDSGDPTVALAESFAPLYLSVAEQQGSVGAREQRLMARIAAARQAASGLFAPDATFTLRFSDGVVSGYPYNGTLAPAYTTFLGMYDAHFSYEPGPDFLLSDRWLDPPATFDAETPLNFVATIDLTGGSSGSPVFTRDLSLVGVAFDSNEPALRNVYLFTEEEGRGIAVDVRGITEAIRDVYGAEWLIEELQEGVTSLSTQP